MDILERFKKYISFDTTSNEESDTIPSTKSQYEFAKILVNDLIEIGLTNAYVDEYGYVYGYINCNQEKTIGLIAHMDTSSDFKGGCKDTQLVKNYNGQEIILKNGDKLNKELFPALNEVIGDDLLFTDGEHLLGGDDKAGIVIIFEIVKHALANHKSMKYNLSICFTVDEEIGRGPLKFDINKMHSDFAFTLDGGSIYEANIENFNASSAKVNFYGINVHPGSAKGIMVNSILASMYFNSLLPSKMIPSLTEGHEGFIHLHDIEGDVSHTKLSYILRDHDEKLLEEKKNMLVEAKNKTLKEFPNIKIDLEMKDEYKNMFPYFLKHREAVELINKAYLFSNTKISYTPIRGGTDGATITYMGLPCPNLGVGDFNCHGKFEFVSLTQMQKMVEILKKLVEL